MKTCFDRNGKVVKRVISEAGEIEDPENEGSEGSQNTQNEPSDPDPSIGGGEHTHSGIDSIGHHKLYGSYTLTTNGAGCFEHLAPFFIFSFFHSFIFNL